ncbi:ribonuclease P protein subunit p40 isoform X2 [Paralichthys olivaceus]|uniref:ribonuclease P protein subunit p40 isoform X2 n=1 Tax=Paralichthys olivaceus TaxID=8255 RepID=UPI003751407F
MSVDVSHAPRSVLVCDRSSFLDGKNRISSQLQQLHFNYKVSMLLPECSSAPSHLDSVLKSFNSFYLIRNMPICELLDKHFLETSVYHVVSVDLTDSSMAPGGRGYVRLLTGLRSRLPLRSDFLLSHHPEGGASLQPLLSRYDWSEHRPEISSQVLKHLSCPALLSSDLQPDDAHSCLEWLGAVDADISCENSSSSFLSSMVCPEPKTTLSRALRVSICGLLLPQDVQRLVQELRCHLQQPRLAPWASLTVHGFVDSPVSWGDGEHGVLTGGENFYNLLMFHDHTYHLHLATGAHDTCPP